MIYDGEKTLERDGDGQLIYVILWMEDGNKLSSIPGLTFPISQYLLSSHYCSAFLLFFAPHPLLT